MSVNIYVKGFKPPDEHWQKMKAIYDACKAANIVCPDEVTEYFDWGCPDEHGVEVDLEATEYHGDFCEGFELQIKDIPRDVTVIRFCISV